MMIMLRTFALLICVGMAVAVSAQNTPSKEPLGQQTAGRQSAQTLLPRLFLNGRDTSFCFNSVQVREIAKRLTAGEYDQQAMNVQMKQITVLSTDLSNQKSITQLREEQIALQEQKLLARDTIIQQQGQALLANQVAIKKQNRTLKRQRTLTKITGVLGIVGIVVALIL